LIESVSWLSINSLYSGKSSAIGRHFLCGDFTLDGLLVFDLTLGLNRFFVWYIFLYFGKKGFLYFKQKGFLNLGNIFLLKLCKQRR